MKEKLCSQPVLQFPKLSERFEVEVDASDHAVGGMLLQADSNDKFLPVAYYSNTLRAEQRRWSPHTKEAFALILALRHWRVYLAGTEFIIRTDYLSKNDGHYLIRSIN